MTSYQTASVQQIVSAVGSVCARTSQPVLLHAPTLAGNEWKYVKECIDTAWVSSVGAYVTEFERRLAAFTGAAHAIVTVNGTAALHIALLLAGVQHDTEVLIPSLTFVATANAVAYCGAIPHFCDVEESTMGMDPRKLAKYLSAIADHRDGQCFNRNTGRRISAIVPMHTFGHPVDLDPLLALAADWKLPVVEDAAESLGSRYRERHTGTMGLFGILSFNGNKIITTGGGGALLTNNPDLAAQAKHLTTTAKLPHQWEFVHDRTGYNYRMPNINAALGCAQMEQLPDYLDKKRRLAQRYARVFADMPGVNMMVEPPGCQSNYWLNALVLNRPDPPHRDALLRALNEAGYQCRPLWRPMHILPMYASSPRMDLSVTQAFTDRVINLPSSASLDGEVT